jgi:hypothetical protein
MERTLSGMTTKKEKETNMKKNIMLCRKEDIVEYIIHLVQQLISVGRKDQLYLNMETK